VRSEPRHEATLNRLITAALAALVIAALATPIVIADSVMKALFEMP
jgi:hypothetical protein